MFYVNLAVFVVLVSGYLYVCWKYEARLTAWLDKILVQLGLAWIIWKHLWRLERERRRKARQVRPEVAQPEVAQPSDR